MRDKKIISFKENDSGQFLIELKGLIRFKIINEVKSSKQYSCLLYTSPSPRDVEEWGFGGLW